VVVLEDENIAEKLCQKLNNTLIHANYIQVHLHQDTCPIKIQKRPFPFINAVENTTKKHKAIPPKEKESSSSSCKSNKMLQLISSIKSLTHMNSTSETSTG
jgi:hypothetical protein